MIHAEERRDIETCISTRSPSGGRSDDKAVVRFPANSLVGKAAKEKFHSTFQFFVAKPKWRDQALGEAPFAAAIAARFLFEEKIEGPFHALEEIFREQKAQLVSIWDVHRSIETAGAKFVRGSWWA